MTNVERISLRLLIGFLIVAGFADNVCASRFIGGEGDGYDSFGFTQPWYGKDRFKGGESDGYDNGLEGTVNLPNAQLSLDQANVVIQLAGGHTSVLYSVLGFNSNLSSAASLLYQISNVTSFAFTDTNALAVVDRRFYRVEEDLSGAVSIQSWVYTVFRRQLDSGTWTKYALGINYGSSNKLNSTLGFQLAQGLTGNNANTSADLFYVLDSQGNWQMCFLNGGGAWCDYNSGVATNTQVLPWQSFWIKRRGGSTTYPVYYGFCFTAASPVTFRSHDWHMITWQLPWDRKESDGPQLGWGFATAGGQKGTSWLNSDLLTVGDGAALRFYYLHTSGRWCAVGQTTPASNMNFHMGESYYYMHRGTGFTWAAIAP